MAETFEGNSKRSEKRLRYDLIPREIIDGLAERFSIGSEKYGDNNWMSGGPLFIRETKNHLQHHYLAYLAGDKEDEKSHIEHLKAVLWNAGALLWFEQHEDSVV